MKAIGIDIGTTSICGVLIDVSDGTLIKKCEDKNDTWINTKNSWEKVQNPDEILNKATNILEKLYCDDVVSIGVTGQMHGILYLSENGDAVSPLYTWQDERGNLPYQNTTYAKSLNSFTGYGYVTHTYNKLNNLIPETACTFCTIHDYIAMKFAGITKPVIHSSDAASFGQYDISKNIFTVDDDLLPEVTSEYRILGKYKNTPVSVAIGDNQASFIGAGGDTESVLINAGTGSQVSAAVSNISTIDGVEFRPYLENKYLMVGCSLCGGKSYAILEQFFNNIILLFTGKKCDNIYEKMNDVFNSKNNTTLITDNRFLGTRQDTLIRGSITNISVDNFTPQDMVISMVDGMSKELFDMYENMKIKCSRIIGSGNGIRKNTAFADSLSKKFNMDIKIPVCCEEASYGVALFSMVCSGVYKNISQAQKIINYGG